MPKYDAIVVGSGLAGVNAAYPLVERGLLVAMLDVGHSGESTGESEMRSFEDIRKKDPDQWRIFLGDDLSGIDVGQGHFRAMVAGRRSYVIRGADDYAPLAKEGIQIPQSFAQGGFSEAWSGGSEIFDDEELQTVGLPPKEMREHYQIVIDRIGVSGEEKGFKLQAPLRIDDSARAIKQRYEKKKDAMTGQGFEISEPKHAILTEDKGERKAHAYRDMDYWDNGGRSLYRARYTLDELKTKPNFTYIDHTLVESVDDAEDGVAVSGRSVADNAAVRFEARSVLLASGALNTTRLLLRSFDLFDTKTPVILKNSYYVPCLFPQRLGKRSDPKRHSFAQLSMNGLGRRGGMSELYGLLLTYNSLLISKLVRYMPLPVPEAFSVLSALTPALVFADLRFPSAMSPDRFLVLRKKGEGDEVEITYPDDETTRTAENAVVAKVKSALRSLGLMPLMTERIGYNMQSHYAGGAPIDDLESKLSTRESGQVSGHDRIFVADSASWRALPAKPSGLTIMANANRVGEEVAKFLQ